MRALALVIVLSVGGCSALPTHGLHVDVKGKNLKTPWGEIEDGEMIVDSTWGKPDVTNIRSTKSAT